MLIKIRVVGRWTIDMFLMFTIHRLKIFPVLDLGLKKGLAKFFGLKKLPSMEIMQEKSKNGIGIGL